ncbi:P66-CC domain-containing protein [Aphelenchoides bicaudatus]|nr:P66-CC domain-containing protein [Aphelenchoides bicaudatus]
MDVDENSLGADSTAEQHQILKAGHSPNQSTLKSQLTNGAFGMEAEDSDYSNEGLLKQQAEEPDQEPGEESFNDQKSESKVQPLDLNCDPEHLNGTEDGTEDDNLPAAELSPNLRRSTRASALKAQEKIRLKDGTTPAMVDSHIAENEAVTANELSAQTTAADTDQQIEMPIKKKRKLSASDKLDQFDCRFGIRLDSDGDVIMMSEGSEISSLNEEEASALRQRYAKLTAREDSDLNAEKKAERDYQVRELESALRLEEAKLAMLKKTRANQQLVARNAQQSSLNRLGITQNSSGIAYKPPVAQQQNFSKLNGTSTNNKNQRNKPGRPSTSPAGNFQLTPQHQQILQKLIEQGNLRPDQLATILHSMNPAALTALTQMTSNRSQQQQKEQQEKEQRLREQQDKERKLRLEQEKEVQRKREEQAEAARLAQNAQNTQQRIAAARTQLRRHLEQQLLQLPPPKAPVPDLSFIPNAAQPDFLYLLGLDLVVQRNLKDKTVFKKVEFDPYVCEECDTDFTPNWKAISGDKGDLHLYCEQCVRQAQKRKIRSERTLLYKKAFQKIAEQEKEFERQVSTGKFNDSSKDSAGKEATTSAQNNVSSKASNFNAAALSGLVANSATAKAFNHSAASLLGSNNTNRNFQNNFGNRTQPKQEPPKKTIPLAQPASRKRTTPTSTGSSSNSNMSAFASLASNPNALAMFQQMASMPSMANALRNMNPMLASMMTNPQMMAQIYAAMMQQQQQQRASSNSNNNVSNLLQAMAQSARNSSSSNQNSSSGQSQSHQSSGGSSSSSANNLLSQMSPALLQQLVAAAAQSRKK